MIGFPGPAQPAVSIIVVCYGRRRLVQRTLQAVLASTPPIYEVVLVDNASPDDTGDWLAREVRGATLLRAPRNAGFGAGANWGALAARSPLLCFLNSDAFVHDGWLDPLLGRLASSPETAAVVPRLLNLDGTLQEAGPVVGSDGATYAFGYGADPARADYRFSRVIDYGSAACLLVRRAAFTRAGGFDATFGIGYFEDVDLALSFGDLGWLTMYEPTSVVTHVRHGSSSEREAARQANLNRTILTERWWRRLALRPTLAELDRRPHRMVSLRDAPASDTVLVVVDGLASRHGDSFGSPASLGSLFRRAPTLRVTLLVLDPAGVERLAPAYWSEGVEVAWGEPDWAVWLASRRFHYSVLVIEGPDGRGRLDALLRATQPQATWVDSGVEAELADALASMGVPPVVSSSRG